MGTLTIAVTGAGGFLGRACVAAALARGHRVRALVRSAETQLPSAADVVVCDLSEGIPEGTLLGVDAVIHVAAAMSNDQSLLARDTTQATANLLDAIRADAGSARVVLASSISVYDAYAAPEGSVVDEDTPLETNLHKREEYTRAKLIQETQAGTSGLPIWILRIGALYDGERVWNVHIGPKVKSVLISLSREGEVPLAHVQNTAEALVSAAETEPRDGQEVLNIVDNNLPSRAEFIDTTHIGRHIRLSWRLLMPFAIVAEALFGARAPGFLRRRVLAARMRPLRYSNERAKERLGWTPLPMFPSTQRSNQ